MSVLVRAGCLLLMLLLLALSEHSLARVATGGSHTLAIKSDGSLWAWGYNGKGQLGDGTVTNRLSAVQIGTDYASVAAGNVHTAAVKTDGTLWTWGFNYYGQLGDGTTTERHSPVQIGTGYATVAAGNAYTLAIKTDGSLWAWGYNGSGNLGDGTTADRHTPVLIGSDFAAVATSGYHTVAIKTDGTLWAWGSNSYGKLGDGTTTSRNSPVQIGTGFKSAAAGANHTVAIKTDGSLWAWGRNNYGQLGDGTNTDRLSPVQIGVGFATVAARETDHTIAIKTGGALWAWGYNPYGQLGDGTTTNRNLPVQIGTDFSEIAAGGMTSGFTIAVKSDGTLWAWGTNGSGQLGDGTTTTKLDPLQISTGFSSVPQLSGIAIVGPSVLDEGASATYAISASYSNGSTAAVDGSLGLAGTSYATLSGATLSAGTVPGDRIVLLNASYTEGAVTRSAVMAVQIKDVPVSASSIWKIAAGGDHTFVIKGDGSLWAWGINNHGQLGDGSTAQSIVPKKIGSGFTDIAAGVWHTVALKSDGSLWTWGSNQSGQLGDTAVTEIATPRQIGTGFSSIAAGSHHTLAVKTDGSLWAWGANYYGQLGDGGTANSTIPKQIGTGFVAVAAGSAHTLAIKSDGSLWTWGTTYYGSMAGSGAASSTISLLPVQVGSGYVSISARGYGSIAVRADGTLWEWGDYEFIFYRQDSQGAVFSSNAPRQIGSGFAAVEAGHDHNLALKADGTLWVWGNDYYGQLADGRGGYSGDSMTPRQIEGEYRAVAAGYGHTVALKSDGSLWAWGYGSYGELGNNTTQGASLPVPVTIKDLLGAPDSLRIEAPSAIAGGSTEALRAIGIWGTDSSPVSPITWSIASGSAGAISENGIFIAKSVTQDETVTVRGTLVTAERSVSAEQTIRVTPTGVDTSPDPLSFNFITVSMNTWCTSNPVLISGIGAPAMIRVEGGFYSVDNGVTWSDKPGTVAPGAIVMLGTTAPSANQVKRVTAYIGDQVGVFGVSTFASSGVPAPIAFAGKTGVAADADVDSDQSDPVTSLSTAAAISVSGPGAQYSIDGGAFTAAAGTLNPGARVTLRVRSSAVAGETVTAVLNIGGILSPFNVTTTGGSASALPDDFAFAYTAHSSVALDSLMTSNTIAVKSLVAPSATIRIENGEYSVNRGPWTSAPGSVKNGDLVALRLRSSAANTTPSSALVFIGGMMKVFNVTTLPAGGTSNIDDTPSPFPFPPQTGVIPGSQVASSPVSVLGISHGTTIKVEGGEYRIVNAAGIDTGFVSYESYVELGDEVSLRQTSSALPLTTTRATLTIGTRSEAFDVTTADTAASTTTTSTTTTTLPATTSTTTSTTIATTTTTTVPSTSLATTTTTLLTTTSSTTIPTTSTTSTTTTTAPTTTSTTTTSSTTSTTTTPTTSTTSTTTTTAPVTTSTTTTSSTTSTTTTPTTSTTSTTTTTAPTTTSTTTTSSTTSTTTTPTTSMTSTTTTTAPVTTSTTTTSSTTSTTTTPTASTTSTTQIVTADLAVGWNLIGNGSGGAIDAAASFGDSAMVNTVWKWVSSKMVWAFYAPSLSAQQLSDYAASKGYEVLTSIDAGEGFWVNAKEAFAIQLPSGAAVSTGSLQSTLVLGWNLVAVGDRPTPSQFNSVFNVTTLWAWNNAQSNWYFYAPSLENAGTLSAYIQQKNYLDFGGKVLDPAMGFWVNKP